MITAFYESIGRVLDVGGHLYGPMRELCGAHFVWGPGYMTDVVERHIPEFEKYLETIEYPLSHREQMEKNHYNKLRYTLYHSVAENFFYRKESVLYTRQAIALSTDCISCIQMKIVNEVIHMNVFMRSSHYDRLLPIDLIFLFGLPHEFTEACIDIGATFDTGWNDKLNEVRQMAVSIMFGSLHRDAK